ncbi:hypothetical protein KGMB01110_03220 [Mediterraneibacter butyricigenes]|uniref:Uncharacterized protein n=1 Tax=Mediterraneibacter butyricigenes TaxID=2316025 RepID=A0A391P1Q8_9FIRM|nr:hypothetical protein KGMB01110_03220 [Mediterraneibacter butyricigenes]
MSLCDTGRSEKTEYLDANLRTGTSSDRTADVKTCEIRRFFCKKDFTEPEKYSIIAKAVIRAANENL